MRWTDYTSILHLQNHCKSKSLGTSLGKYLQYLQINSQVFHLDGKWWRAYWCFLMMHFLKHVAKKKNWKKESMTDCLKMNFKHFFESIFTKAIRILIINSQFPLLSSLSYLLSGVINAKYLRAARRIYNQKTHVFRKKFTPYWISLVTSKVKF